MMASHRTQNVDTKSKPILKYLLSCHWHQSWQQAAFTVGSDSPQTWCSTVLGNNTLHTCICVTLITVCKSRNSVLNYSDCVTPVMTTDSFHSPRWTKLEDNILHNFFLCYVTMFAKPVNLVTYFDYFFTITCIIFIWVCLLPTACSFLM